MTGRKKEEILIDEHIGRLFGVPMRVERKKDVIVQQDIEERESRCCSYPPG